MFIGFHSVGLMDSSGSRQRYRPHAPTIVPRKAPRLTHRNHQCFHKITTAHYHLQEYNHIYPSTVFPIETPPSGKNRRPYVHCGLDQKEKQRYIVSEFDSVIALKETRGRKHEEDFDVDTAH